MKVLITGGAGFVGSSLARHFIQDVPDTEVTVFDNLRRRGSELNLKSFRDLGIHFVHGDVRNLSDIAASGTDFDLFIEAAAEPSVHAGTHEQPDYVVETNLSGTFNCLKFAHRHAREFIFLSTSRVYSIAALRAVALKELPTRFALSPEQVVGGVSIDGISEKFDTSLPRSFYGATKLASEYLVQEFTEAYGLKSIIYRCGVIAGPGQFGKVDQGVFTYWVAQHYFGKPLAYTGFGGEGKQVRDLLHPSDLFELINQHLKIADRQAGTIYNVGGGSGNSISLAEMTTLCENVVGKSVPVEKRPETTRIDVSIYVSDCSRVSSEVNWRPIRSVEIIVSDIFNWIRKNEFELRSLCN
jgi:CDP-paratose 2-epimerase